MLRTGHETATALLRVLDALVLEPGARGHEIGLSSPDALVRVVEAADGDVEVAADYRPRPEYGLAVPRLVREGGLVVSIGGQSASSSATPARSNPTAAGRATATVTTPSRG